VIKRFTVISWIVVLACAHAGAMAQTSPSAATPSAPIAVAGHVHAGILKSVHGDVKVLGPNGSVRTASSGDTVAPIDRIVTGPDSGASVVLRDGTRMVLGPSSRLDFKDFHFDSTTQEGGMFLSLLQGSLRMISGLIGKLHPDAVRVETPMAVIGIRGTDFIIQADPLS
jgi:hypothetical protein